MSHELRVCVPCSRNVDLYVAKVPDVKTFHKGLYERRRKYNPVARVPQIRPRYQFVRVGWRCEKCGNMVNDE